MTPLGAPECMSDSLLCLSHAARCSHAPLRIVLPMLFMTLPAHPSLSTHALLCMWVHTATPQAEASASPPVGQHPTCAVRDGIVARRVSSWLVGCVRAHISSLSSSPHTQYMAGFGMPLCGRKASADRGNQAGSGGIRGIGGRIGRRRRSPSCSTPPSTPLHPPHPPPRPHAATPSHRRLTSCAE